MAVREHRAQVLPLSLIGNEPFHPSNACKLDTQTGLKKKKKKAMWSGSSHHWSLSDSLSSHTLNLASSLHTYCVATLTTCHYFSTTFFFLFLIANWHTHFPHLCHFQEMFFSFTCFTAIKPKSLPSKKLHIVRVPGSSWPNEIQHKVHFLNSLEHNTKPVECCSFGNKPVCNYQLSVCTAMYPPHMPFGLSLDPFLDKHEFVKITSC